jgi:phosphatidylglycerol:prolipoprotein diacylglycerol transferase
VFPDLISIGPLTIHTYGFFVALGVASGILLAANMGRAQDMGVQQIMDMGFIMVLWGIVGSRIMYVLMNISFYLNHPLDVLKIWEGGLVFSGGLIAVVIAMIFYLRRQRFSIWKTGDIWAPALALGQSIGRIGCFMAGCCYGKATDLPWGVVFTHPRSLAPLHVALHPTQLYSVLSGLVVFCVLMVLQTRKKFEGQIFLWFLILHSTARLFIERFRGDERGLVPGTEMTVTQLCTLLILMASVVVLLFLKTKQEKKETSSRARTC